jgi:hypothetical protein
MTQLKRVVDPFGEVNVYPAPAGKVRVVATILMEPNKEGAQTGIALDGSGSMAKLYGLEAGGGIVSPLFARKTPTNEITPIAQKLCAYLARKIDADGGTTVIYWATGENGSQIEVVGDLRAEEAEKHIFGPPRDFGTGTQLLPAVHYFVERFKDAPWGFYVFITDGELHDLDAVKHFSTWLAREIAAGKRQPVKFVLIGVGPDISEKQMEELDDLDTGTPIDLWDHKLAKEMRVLQEMFAEVVDQNARVADHGRILDATGRVVKDFSGSGLPAQFEFEVPTGQPYFTLEVLGNRIHQGLFEMAQVPPSQYAGQAAPPTLPATPPPLPGESRVLKPAVVPAAPPKPAPAAKKDDDEVHEGFGMERPLVSEEEWKGIDFGPIKQEPGVDLNLEKDDK